MMYDLLNPRYEVTCDYPGNPFNVGSILTTEGETVYYFNIQATNLTTIEKYPHLFKRLKWHERREEAEMPKYISYISLTKKEEIYGDVETAIDSFFKARVFQKVDSWHKKELPSGGFEWYYNDNSLCTLCDSHLPATEEEYKNYISNNQILQQ